jgi:hypothetical protein
MVLAPLLGVALSIDGEYIKEQNYLANEYCIIKIGLSAFNLRPLAKRNELNSSEEDYNQNLDNNIYGNGSQLIFNICQFTKEPANGE